MQKFARFVVLVFIFTIPWENAFIVSTLGSLTRVIGLAAAGIWIISVIFRNRLRKIQIYHIVVFLFILDNVASIIWTLDYDYTLAHLKTYLQLGILAWMLWDLITTSESMRDALQAFILGGYVVIASSFYNFLSGQTISQYEYGRFSGAGQNAVELALILSLSVPIAWHLATNANAGAGSNTSKVINFAYIPTALAATILTGSRTALLTLIPAFIYIFGSVQRLKPIYRLIIAIIFILSVFIGQSFIPQATLARLGTIGDSISAGDIGGRVALWKESFSIFLDHFLLGIGSGALVSPDQMGGAAHNTFLSVLAELGLIGIVLFVGILFIVFMNAITQPKAYAILWLTVLSVWLIGIQSLTYEYTKSTWFFLNMIVISASIYHRRISVALTAPSSKKTYPSINAARPRPT
jgi:O-antigen ligase